MTAPMSITGPASLIAAVPYLLGFEPTDSLVLVALRHGALTVTARVDLVHLDDSAQLPDLMEVLATKASATEVVGLTYGPRDTAEHAGELVADAARAHGLQLRKHVRVADGRYWSLTCTDTRCCPAEGTPVSDDPAVAAEFVGIGAPKLASRQDLEALLNPVQDTERLAPLIRDAVQTAAAAVVAGRRSAHVTSAKRALFAAARRTERRWTDEETARFGEALSLYEIRDAVWLAIEDGRLDGRDLFQHLARTLPASHRAPALFLFAWKTWRAGNGALASIAVERALTADPTYSGAQLLRSALSSGVNPTTMPRLKLAG